jgi:NAD(P)-dependent dehydrogenase (short-subunit alcohol dehydrogenase family)
MTQTETSFQREMDFPAGVAVVVGGSGGIGIEICSKLAQAGSDVVLTYRNNTDAAMSAVNNIKSMGRLAEAFSVSIEDEGQVNEFFSSVVEKHGRVHTVVNATGSSIPMLFINQVPGSTWREVMDNDVNGFFNIVQASLPHMREKGGSYVVISTAGLKRWPTRDVLSVAPKAAVDALVTGIAREEGKFGIRANSVALGLIDAGLFQRLRGSEYSEAYVEAAIKNSSLKRLGTAGEVADAVVFFASDKARFVTGQTLVLDGGYSL